MSTDNPLALLDKASQLLMQIVTIEDATDVIDIAETGRIWAKRVLKSIEAQNQAAEVRLRAERKAGKWLQEHTYEMGKKPAEIELVGPKSTSASMAEVRMTLDEASEKVGVVRRTLERWKEAAGVSEEEFEDYLKKTVAANEELSSAGVRRILNKAKNQLAKDRKREKEGVMNRAKDAKLKEMIEFRKSVESKLGRPISNPKEKEIIEAIGVIKNPETLKQLHDAIKVDDEPAERPVESSSEPAIPQFTFSLADIQGPLSLEELTKKYNEREVDDRPFMDAMKFIGDLPGFNVFSVEDFDKDEEEIDEELGELLKKSNRTLREVMNKNWKTCCIERLKP